ncbi:signal peptidase I [Candidatus Roizmanbacteria bacterium CG_4_10_14_0_8_um_filter_33_9]|uniref:Signal peptidase I n=1 Tax=Candidatus Roizmanbacteria bacterium CG_4_10_14_0_8_um_filter_33_9 TaxID=1974826 RepID=A0A2M7QJP5_9BACT|nr:MAG: signal peptidase I [Candidatus Roizmanbacteria bacterium CG_4_10_14_0_8_um_filter_33_9]
MDFISYKNLKSFRSSFLYIFLCVFFIIHALLSIAFSRNLPLGIKLFSSKWKSMEPVIYTGSLLIVREQPDYNKGDIITYYSQINNKEEIITHRVYRIGGNVYTTKGDANEAIDEQIILPRLVIGKVIGIIPKMGDYLMFLRSSTGLLICITFPMILILNVEVFTIFGILEQNGKKLF